MSQGSLFDAAVYLMRGYDQLALAYNEAELEQLRSLKQQCLRTYLALMDMVLEVPMPPEQLTVDQEDVPF
jgi:hypothetical protein